MIRPVSINPAMIATSIWVLTIFGLYMLQFKPIILSLLRQAIS